MDEILAFERLLDSLIRRLVDHQEHVRVTALTEGATVRLLVQVAPEELGKVIGKQGRTAQAIRTILVAASRKLGISFALDIVSAESDPPSSGVRHGAGE